MKWISVKDRLPEGEVLAINVNNDIMIGWLYLDNEVYCESDECIMYDVTHWMPLPEPPKEEE